MTIIICAITAGILLGWMDVFNYMYLVNLKSHKKASKIPFFSMGFSLYQARLYCLAGSVATC